MFQTKPAMDKTLLKILLSARTGYSFIDYSTMKWWTEAHAGGGVFNPSQESLISYYIDMTESYYSEMVEWFEANDPEAAVIVSAYTGYIYCGEAALLDYCSKVMRRPVEIDEFLQDQDVKDLVHAESKVAVLAFINS